MRNQQGWIVLVLLVILTSSCGKFRKIQKNPDWRVKYEAAMKYYEKEDYFKANLLLEEVLPIARGLPESETILFYYAYSYYHQGQYLLASHNFRTFYQTYSRSPLAQEAEFMYAYSLYRESPNYNLDQSSTVEAIVAMQIFLNKNPASRYRPEAIEIIDQLQVKLEKKAYENSKQYYKVGRFQSAVIALDNFTKDYPASVFAEEIYFLKLDAQYNLAKLSIPGKREERYRETVRLYQEFIEKFPNTSFRKDAESIHEDSSEKLNKIAEN